MVGLGFGNWSLEFICILFLGYSLNFRLLNTPGGSPMASKIKVYGTKWCPDCARVKQIFSWSKVDYDWIDIEQDPAAAEEVVKINKGNKSVPTIVFPDGSVLVEPSNAELEKKLA
jgi:mycoredoxin